MRLDEVANKPDVVSFGPVFSCSVVQMSFCQRFAVSLEVNGGWSCFRIFINSNSSLGFHSLLCPD